MAIAERRALGRYMLYGPIAAGGMATVHYGRLLGPVGFARTVAIKRLHPHLARDPEFVAMFLDEARLVARIRHPNVVQTLDIVAVDGELLLVMDYIQGESLGRLIRAAKKVGGVPPAIASAMMVGVLEGLHAAHEAKSDRGEPLGIVHRDVSPQNVIIGADGVAHVLDFGVAKAAGRLQQTDDGKVKGKFAYMSPEQLGKLPIDRRTDVFAASAVLWETLTSKKLYDGDSPASVVMSITQGDVPPPSSLNPSITPALDAVVLKGLAKVPDQRYASAHEMALALEDVVAPATPRKVQEWVRSVAAEVLSERARCLAEIESDSAVSGVPTDPEAARAVIPSLAGTPSAPQRIPSVFPPGAGDTQVLPNPLGASSSGVSVTGWAPSTAPPRRSRAGIAIGAAAFLGVGLAATLYLALGSDATSAAAVGSAAGAAAPGPPLAGSSAPAPPPGETTTALSPSSASATARASALPGEQTAAKPPGGAARPAPPPPPQKRVDCSNPFTIDQSGRKRPRPECF